MSLKFAALNDIGHLAVAMKLIRLPILFFFLLNLSVHAEHGLENILVERYYVSNADDSVATDKISERPGTLPVGSVTYRIYVDMLPGYRFQAAYGIPGHELKIATTTTFFNNEDYGGELANVIADRALPKNTVMLDSWLSVGAASEMNLGILKTEDDTVSTVVNADRVLQGTSADAGVPVKERDGLIKGEASLVTGFGLDSAIKIFRNRNSRVNGQLFSLKDASWAALKGSTGPTKENRVLIAQITTNGILSFELNIQIGTPWGGTEQYVARDPSGEEILLPSLSYSSNKDTSGHPGNATGENRRSTKRSLN